MNLENWINSFDSKAQELTKLSTYRSKLIHRFTNFRDVQIWEMYGKFKCQNCYKRKRYKVINNCILSHTRNLLYQLLIYFSCSLNILRNCFWTSTQCTTDIKYRYDSSLNQGEIVIEKEYCQSCKRCETFENPKFDQEATDRAICIVIEKIKKAMYGIEDPNKTEFSSRHSSAQDRKAPHDSDR